MLIHLTPTPDVLTKVISEGRLRAMTPYGAAYNVESLAASQAVVCFSEMRALESVSKLAERHGAFGVGFSKRWLEARGAAPVWYLTRGSELQRELFELVRSKAFSQAPVAEDPLWRLTPFMDYPRDPAVADSARPYDWRWEREWRVRGDVRFSPSDAKLLFAPFELHAAVKEWWVEQVTSASGGYLPPLVDTAWPRERQERVIRLGPAYLAPLEAESSGGWLGPVGASAPASALERRRREALDELDGWLDAMESGEV